MISPLQRHPEVPGLRAVFAARVGVVIQEGPNGAPRKIEKVEGGVVYARGLKSGRISKITKLERYRVSPQN